MWAFPNCHQQLWQPIKEAIVEDWRSSWFQNTESSLGQEHWWKGNRRLAVFMSGSRQLSYTSITGRPWALVRAPSLSVTFCESPDSFQAKLLSWKQSWGAESSMKNRHCIANEISWGNKFLTSTTPFPWHLPLSTACPAHSREGGWSDLLKAHGWAVLCSQLQRHLLGRIYLKWESHRERNVHTTLL